MPHCFNPARILITRRDNIGDMVCTTPLLRSLRERFPSAYIAILASSYNEEAIRGNPDVDEVFVYLRRQGEHGKSYLSMLKERLRLLWKIRKQRFDLIIMANGGWRYARQLGGKTLMGFKEFGSDRRQPDWIVPLPNALLHEVEKLNQVCVALNAPEALGSLSLQPDAETLQQVQDSLLKRGWCAERETVIIHISSRRPQQRWPTERFVELIQCLHRQSPERQFMLLWSPGSEDHPLHPGDDAKASTIVAACKDLPLFPAATDSVRELIATMSLCDTFVGSDGGAMHVAAGLSKPVLCFFGDSRREEWRPWGVPYVLLQPESLRVDAISVAEAVEGFAQLQALSQQ